LLQGKPQVKGAPVQDELAVRNFDASQAKIAPDAVDILAIFIDKADLGIDEVRLVGGPPKVLYFAQARDGAESNVQVALRFEKA